MSEPIDPDRFLGDYDGFIAYAEEHWKPGQLFCPKHWAPCPVEGRNGMLATVEIMQEAINLMPPNVTSPEARNRWMKKQLSQKPICCVLGEEKMEEIWDMCTMT